MRYPWANTLLLLFLLLQLATGVGALLSGDERFRWVLWLHGVGAYAVALLLFWKGAIIWNVLRRRKVTWARVAFLGMLLLLLLVLATGFYWTFIGPATLLGYSVMVAHGTLAVLLVLPLLWHLVARRWILRVPQARDRRAFLRLVTSGVAGLATWRVARSSQASERRFTGSYEQGSFTGQFPTVSWLFDRPGPLEPVQWNLRIDGAVERPLQFSLEALLALSQSTIEETLDCTGGWYSRQEWRGVSVAELLRQVGISAEARSVTVEAVTGYRRRFDIREIRRYLLATQVAGQPLTHGHGAPLRLVAPGHRGYDWVKWIVRLSVNESSHYRQAPLPLQ